MKFITYEERMYSVHDSLVYISRRNQKLVKNSYQSPILHDLSNIEIQLDNNLQSLLFEAIEELSKLDGFIKDKLNGFPMIVLRSESLSSAQIEHYHASNRNIAAAQIRPTKNKETNIIKNNLESLVLFLKEENKIDKETIVKINSKIMDDESVDIRTKVNWIGESNSIPHTADFVPPHPEYLDKNINEFISFCKRDDIHPLVQAAFAYAYFETIHPFIDGNGRTGRIFIQVLLKEKNYLDELYVPFSMGLIKNDKKHIEALNEFRKGNYRSIIKLFLENSLGFVPIIYKTLKDLIAIKDRWLSKISARSDALAWKIIDELIYQPVVSVNYIKEKYQINDQAVRNNFNILEKADIINKIGNSKRNVMYEAKEIISLIDELTLNK